MSFNQPNAFQPGQGGGFRPTAFAPEPFIAPPIQPPPTARPRLLATLYRTGLVQLNKAAAEAAQAMDTTLRVQLIESNGAWYLVRRADRLGSALSYRFGGPAKFHATAAVRAFFAQQPDGLTSVQCWLDEVPAKVGRAFRITPVEIVENEF